MVKLFLVNFDPIKNEIFFAEKNNGAYFNNNRIRVSNKNNLDECLFATNQHGIKKVNFPKLNLRNTGCAALRLSLCWVWKIRWLFS